MMFKHSFNISVACGRLGALFLPRFKSYLNMQNSSSNRRIVWMDMEMSGLDIDNDRIMEVACLVTDSDLNIVAEGPNLIIHQPDSILDNMNDWCTKQHTQTGLIEESRRSTVSLQQAEDELLVFISKHVLQNSSPLAGNSIYMDRLFLRRYMPRINNYLHYRIIDVSSIKELCRMWAPDLYRRVPSKNVQHRALSDINESVKELKFYRSYFFRLDQINGFINKFELDN